MLMGKAYTIQDFIQEYEDETLSFNTLQFKEIIKKNDSSKMILASDTILLKYNEELRNATDLLTLSDAEVNKFAYNPKFLSYELYGTTELWFLLLHANEMHYASQFSINPVRVYNASIVGIIDRILSLEKNFIDINRVEIKKAMK